VREKETSARDEREREREREGGRGRDIECKEQRGEGV